jgi:Ca2+-binding RTX toxin-like protein
MAAMGAAMLLVSGVAYALSVQCDGIGDQDPDLGECQGTGLSDVITGTAQRDFILALGGLDVVSARGGNDRVEGDRGSDDISGGAGVDLLNGGAGPDDIDGGPGTPDGEPIITFECGIRDLDTGIDARNQVAQWLIGHAGNDDLDGGRDNDFLEGGPSINDLSGNGGDDCLDLLFGDENQRASGGDGDDLIFAAYGSGDDVFCGAGHDTVRADEEDRVAANCEDVIREPSLQATGATPEPGVTITTAP